MIINCASYNCNSVRNNSECVKELLYRNDVVFLQELMLNQSDLSISNDFNKDVEVIAYVKDREIEGIHEGRPSRGVAIFWKRSLSPFITLLKIDDRMIAVILDVNGEKIMMMTVYMPCDLQTFDALDNYKHMLAKNGNNN